MRKALVPALALVLLALSAPLFAAAPAATPAAPSPCSALAFLLAPALTPSPIPASPAVCACGDALCNGHVAGASCGSHRICLATGSCTSSAAKSCVCVTQDPPP